MWALGGCPQARGKSRMEGAEDKRQLFPSHFWHGPKPGSSPGAFVPFAKLAPAAG